MAKKCESGKLGHVTEAAAHAALTSMLKRGAKNGMPSVQRMNVYRCGCGSFHVGGSRKLIWDLVNKPIIPLSARGQKMGQQSSL